MHSTHSYSQTSLKLLFVSISSILSSSSVPSARISISAWCDSDYRWVGSDECDAHTKETEKIIESKRHSHRCRIGMDVIRICMSSVKISYFNK